MKTFEDLIQEYSLKLKSLKLHRPRMVVEELVSNILNVSRCDLFYFYEKTIEKTLSAKIKRALNLILKGNPVEYVIGRVEFYGCTIKVNPSVLIPRQETEFLMDYFVKSSIASSEKCLFDICCGSGCLAVSAKKKFPELNVYASDISQAALNTAKENAKINEVDVSFLKGSLFKPYQGLKADYILCNPPYLSESEFKEINDTKEPSLALIGGKSGLEFYEKIANEILDYVNPGAKIFLEIGYSQGDSVNKIFEKIPCRNKWLKRDLAGLDRFFFLEIE